MKRILKSLGIVGEGTAAACAAFLRDVSSGKIFLAHRGIVTLGHGPFQKDQLLEAMGSSVFEAATSNGLKEFLLMGELGSKTLLQEVSSFSAPLRSVLRELSDGVAISNVPGVGRVSKNQNQRKFGDLREYLNGFTGKRRAFKPKKVQADPHHGLVGQALEKALQSSGAVLNSREIDLVAVRTKDVLLFEIKTSSAAQSVYTAVGQLSVHAPRLA